MDATSLANVSKCNRSASDKSGSTGSSQGSQPAVSTGAAAPPNAPAFTLKDLDFIVKFSQVCACLDQGPAWRRKGCGLVTVILHLIAMVLVSALMAPLPAPCKASRDVKSW